MGKKNLCALLLGIALCVPVYSYADESNSAAVRVPVQYEFGDYMTGVRDKIAKAWNPPDVLEEGHASVVFKLDKNGNVISAYIKESSGNRLYDESALNSVQNASPYAEFPENATREIITIQYSFDSSIVKTDHIKELVDLAERYTNNDNKRALSYIDTAIHEIEGDPAAYFLYARRHKLDKLMGNQQAAEFDLAECKRLKALYDKKRINKCKEALAQEETPFGYFTLANAYDLAGDYNNAIYNIDKAIGMTELNHAYKRYRAEILLRNKK